MDGLDGMLLVPPDRSQILGRAVWKARYVVVGRRAHQSVPSYSQLMTTSRVNAATKPASKPATDEYSISVYKSKEDWEPIQHWPLSCITDCQVQSLAHRKQGPVLPTLVVSLTTDKERKRRSSRAGFIAGNKENAASALWFRTPTEDHQLSLHDWARFILSRKTPLSPESPSSPIFTNPFSPRSREIPEYFPRPNSGPSNRGDPRSLHHKSSTATYSTGRERPITFGSESPSLRSKRSDVSSNHAQGGMCYAVPGQHYTYVHPSEMASQITSIGEYQGELIDGWTAAQGRSSTMSSPIHGRDSISSQAPQSSLTESSSPPAPRETILDRAFQLKFIPGSDQEVVGEEKLTSLARFDALMREVDEKRKQREAAERARQTVRSTFEADDSSDEAEGSDQPDLDDTDSDDDNYLHEQDARDPRPLIPPTAKRALDFITSQDQTAHSPVSPRPNMSRTALSFHADSMPQGFMMAGPARPHTAHAKTRPVPGQRANSVSQAVPVAVSNTYDMPALVSKPSEDGTLRPSVDKRQSTSSTKRLSFTEFTKRLSSTSSLLLVQTNASGGSSRGSCEVDIRPTSVPRATLNPRGAGPPPPRPLREGFDNSKPCNWRNSVGVIGTEGGFL